LAILGLFAALYSIYLIYLGVPVLMRVPERRAVGYTAVLVVCGIVAGVLVAALTALFTPGGNPFGNASDSVRITVPGTDFAIDTGRIDAAGRALEQAQSRGDSEAAAQATGELVASALGGRAQPALDAQRLRALVPDTFSGQARSSIEAGTTSLMGIDFTHVSAAFGSEDKRYALEIVDVGAVPILALGMTAWARTTYERDDNEEVERSYRRGDVAIRESYRKDGSRAELSMLLPNGLMIEADGPGPLAELDRQLQPLAHSFGALDRSP